jgi:hypothetical protein
MLIHFAEWEDRQSLFKRHHQQGKTLMTNEATETVMTRDEALKFIRKTKQTIYLRGASDLPTKDGRAFVDITAFIPASRKIAAKYVVDLLCDSFVNRGAKIRVKIYPHSVFIG